MKLLRAIASSGFFHLAIALVISYWLSFHLSLKMGLLIVGALVGLVIGMQVIRLVQGYALTYRVSSTTGFRLYFEKRDLWIGLYWTVEQEEDNLIRRDLYICLIPCFPLRIRTYFDPWKMELL